MSSPIGCVHVFVPSLLAPSPRWEAWLQLESRGKKIVGVWSSLERRTRVIIYAKKQAAGSALFQWGGNGIAPPFDQVQAHYCKDCLESERLSFVFHIDHIVSSGIALAVANQIKELIEGLVGLLIAGLGTEEDALGGHMTHEVNVDHLVP